MSGGLDIGRRGFIAGGLSVLATSAIGAPYVEGETPSVEVARANQELRQATDALFRLPNDQIQEKLSEFSSEDRAAIRGRLETQILDSRGFTSDIGDLTQRIIDDPGSVSDGVIERLADNPSLVEFFQDLQDRLADGDPSNDPTRDEIREGYQEWRSDYLDQVDQAINTLGLRAGLDAPKVGGPTGGTTLG